MTITTLLFDIGDVLIDIDWQRGYQKMLGHLHGADGRPLTIEEIADKLQIGSSRNIWDDFGLGKVSQDDFLAGITKELNYRGDPMALQRGLAEQFEPLPERIALLNELIEDSDLTIALVSDTNALHMDHIENYIPDIFKNIPPQRRFYSHRTGKAKKLGAAFYEHVLESLGVAPQNALMIDDRIQNRPGADAIGLNFLLIQKNEDLRAALQPYLT